MAEALTIDFAQPIPLFPLDICPLLPHAAVPLHIFEPRYQAMTRDALNACGLIAMAVFEGEQWKNDYHGQPPVRDHVCVGYIVRHQRLGGGRYNILVQGVCRARIVREVAGDEAGYRLAMLEPTETDEPMEIDLDDHRTRLERLMHDRKLSELAAVRAVHDWLEEDVPTTALIDLVILSLCPNVEDRYRMLAEPDVEQRAQWVERYLRQTRALLEHAERFEPGVSEDGVPLN